MNNLSKECIVEINIRSENHANVNENNNANSYSIGMITALTTPSVYKAANLIEDSKEVTDEFLEQQWDKIQEKIKSSPLTDEEPKICDNCEGHGWTIEIDIESECCGNFIEPFVCCNNPSQKQIQVQSKCEKCVGYGLVTSNIQSTQLTDKELEAEAERLYPSCPDTRAFLPVFGYHDMYQAERAAHIKARKMGSSGLHSDAVEFDKAVISERDSFCHHINSMQWDSVLRTYCESLLIMYDQMRERLLHSPPKTEV
jgi:hypothetical protein